MVIRVDNILQGFSRKCRSWAKGWLILVLLAALAIFAALTLPDAKKASGGHALDAEFFYTPGKAFATIESYGEAGRNWIRIYYLTADLVNPLLYSLFLALLISWLFQRGFKPGAGAQLLNLLPFGAAVFDVLENIGLVTMLSVHPERPEIVAWLSAVCTMLKSIFLMGSILVLLGGFLRAATNGFRIQV